jgi:hypothetical protein
MRKFEPYSQNHGESLALSPMSDAPSARVSQKRKKRAGSKAGKCATSDAR